MDKKQMADKYAAEMIGTLENWDRNVNAPCVKNIAKNAWDLAEAMHEEGKNREMPVYSIDPWQPDWSVAPEGTVAWMLNPLTPQHQAVWLVIGEQGFFHFEPAPQDHGFMGHWINSAHQKPSTMMNSLWNGMKLLAEAANGVKGK